MKVSRPPDGTVFGYIDKFSGARAALASAKLLRWHPRYALFSFYLGISKLRVRFVNMPCLTFLQANGFHFGLQHICVVQTIICFFYTQLLCYDVAHLPISETQFLMCLYRSAVNKNLASLANAVYSRLRRPETQLGNAHDIKATLKIAIHGMIGKRAAGQKRRKEIQEALIERFGEEIWDNLEDDDLAQFFRDSWEFASIMLEAITRTLRYRMAEQGIYLDELD